MAMKPYKKLQQHLTYWLTREPALTEVLPCDFNRLKREIRPGDVILIEGRSRVSQIIRKFTQSTWTHAALYIGRADEIEDDAVRNALEPSQTKDGSTRLIVEGLLGKGMIISPLSKYRDHHIRICRPIGLSAEDAQLVIAHAVKFVGQHYNVRQLLDLARFLLPWSVLPRHWGSSLFTTPSGEPESGICSSVIAEAFTSVKFPILPFLISGKETRMELVQRNPYIFSPKDFDYSPYFEIIKYPILNPAEELPYYRRMPWTEEEIMHQGRGVFVHPKKIKKQRKFLRKLISRVRRKKSDESNSLRATTKQSATENHLPFTERKP